MVLNIPSLDGAPPRGFCRVTRTPRNGASVTLGPARKLRDVALQDASEHRLQGWWQCIHTSFWHQEPEGPGGAESPYRAAGATRGAHKPGDRTQRPTSTLSLGTCSNDRSCLRSQGRSETREPPSLCAGLARLERQPLGMSSLTGARRPRFLLTGSGTGCVTLGVSFLYQKQE